MKTNVEDILIGGAWADNIVYMENHFAQLTDLKYQLYANECLCVLSLTPEKSVEHIPLRTDGAYSLMGIWERKSSVEQPASGACSAEPPASPTLKQPASPPPKHLRSVEQPASPPPKRLRSVEQPASSTPRPPDSPPPRRVVLKQSTPLYNKLIAQLEPAAETHRSGEAFIDYITECCFHGKLLDMDKYGRPSKTKVPLSVKMENLLRVAQAQRQMQMQRLRHRRVRREVSHLMHMHPVHDMREIYNTWRSDVESWMKPSTLAKYKRLWGAAAHKLQKRALSTYLFQLSGCKFLLHKLIELPLISATRASAGQPTEILFALIDDYEKHKASDQYEEARENAKKRKDEELRLSNRLWWAQTNYTQGKMLSHMVQHKQIKWEYLDDWNQQLVHDYETRALARELDEAHKQKASRQQPYRGAGTETKTSTKQSSAEPPADSDDLD